MTQKPFAGAHTAKKLKKLEEYLKAYLTVLKRQEWVHTIYFDAFAGTGNAPVAVKSAPTLPLDSDGADFIVGSARRALELQASFSEYVFVEKGRGKARELDRLKEAYPAKAQRIRIEHNDANTALMSFCSTRDWKKCRAVVFLDPFGNQVEWRTIEAIAGTKAIDLWYLFPAGLGVHRQIGRDGGVHSTHEASLDASLVRRIGGKPLSARNRLSRTCSDIKRTERSKRLRPSRSRNL